MDFDVLLIKAKTFLKPFWLELTNLEFHWYNPIFWTAILFLFFILSFLWYKRKAFSYSLIVSAILLINTQLESIFALRFEGFDPLLVRSITFILLSVLTLYYAFLKAE